MAVTTYQHTVSGKLLSRGYELGLTQGADEYLCSVQPHWDSP